MLAVIRKRSGDKFAARPDASINRLFGSRLS